MELLFPGQIGRDASWSHTESARSNRRCKTLLSLQMQLKMQRFSHVIHMALAEAEKTKPPEANSCECQSYLSEPQFCLEENRGGRLIFCQCCWRCLCQSTGCEFAWNFRQLFSPLVSMSLFSPLIFYLVLPSFHAFLLLSLPSPYIHVLSTKIVLA